MQNRGIKYSYKIRKLQFCFAVRDLIFWYINSIFVFSWRYPKTSWCLRLHSIQVPHSTWHCVYRTPVHRSCTGIFIIETFKTVCCIMFIFDDKDFFRVSSLVALYSVNQFALYPFWYRLLLYSTFKRTVRHVKKCQQELANTDLRCQDGEEIKSELNLACELMLLATRWVMKKI